MKRIGLTAIGLLVFLCVWAQQNTTELPPKRLGEFSLYGFAGMSSIRLKANENPWETQSHLSAGFGINYTWFLMPQWALSLGLEYNTYKTTISAQYFDENFTRILEGQEVNIKNHFDEYSESIDVDYLSAPLMLQYIPSGTAGNSFYAGIGLKPSYFLFSTPKLNARGKSDPPSTIPDIKGMGPFTYIDAGTREFPKKINLFLSLEAGLRWNLESNNALYTGLFFDYGLLPINAAGDKGLYDYDGLKATQYARSFAGILSSYHTTNAHFWNAGIKLRMAIGRNQEEQQPVNNVDATTSFVGAITAIRVSVRNMDDSENIPATLTAETFTGRKIRTADGIGEDFGFRISGKESHRATVTVNMPPEINIDLLRVATPVFTTNTESTENGSRVNLYLRDSATEAYLSGFVKIYDMDNQRQTADMGLVRGGVSVLVPTGSTYRVVFNLQARKTKSPFKKIKKGAKATFLNLQFTKKNTLTSKSQLKLEEIILFMKSDPDISIEVGSHINNKLPEAANKRLTTARAKAIVKYMVQQGIEQERLQSVGYGAARLKSSNPAAPQNTRVEFTITSSKKNKSTTTKSTTQ